MALKGLDTTTTLWSIWRNAAGCAELPHLDGFVQTATDEVTSIGRERHTVDTVLVAVGPLETLHKQPSGNIPHADALVKRSSRHVLCVGRNGHCSHAILYRQCEDIDAGFDIPESDSTITTARRNGSAIAGKVKGIDVLLMASKGVANGSCRNIPYLNTVSYETSEILSSCLTLIILSSAPVAKYLPSGLKHTLRM